ncbi:hypothetical protein [Bacteroides sp.]|uniref:hypothetical protein n=1 Tax=Bacteroides sp. TaxID=29523 RepID=UPI002FC8F793
MFDVLKKYDTNGVIEFDVSDSLNKKCRDSRIPKHCSGIYIVNALSDGREEIVYIGSSGNITGGQKEKQAGRLGKRIIGKQRDLISGKLVRRNILWPQLMEQQFIDHLKVSWYSTDADNSLIVEYCLLLEFVIRHKRLPIWNNELKLSGQLKGELEEFIVKNNIETLKI